MSLPNKTYFWAAAAKSVQQSLFYTPASDATPEEVLSLIVRDCDGEEINKAEVIFPSGRNCIFEVEHFLGLMKLESGIKHGLVTLESQSRGRMLSRYQCGQNISFVPSDQLVTNIKQGLIAINNFGDRRTMIALTNCEDTTTDVRGKLLLSKRSPEVSWQLPPYSSRIFDLNHAFTSAIGEENFATSGRGYLRLSTSAMSGVLVHSLIYDRLDDENQTFQIL